MLLITAFEQECTDCAGVGQRPDENHPCPTCDGTRFEPIAEVVDGKLYRLFPQDILEVENKIHAQAILHHKAYMGVVELKMERIGSEFRTDREGALAVSKQRIFKANKDAVEEYIRLQQEGPLAAGKPAAPPMGKYKRGVEVLGIDLAKHNIRPPGYQVESQLKEQAEATKERDELREQVKELSAQVAMLIQMQSGQHVESKPKGKAKVAA